MKNLAYAAAAVAATLACAASAQTVETIIAAKAKWFVQPGASTVNPSVRGPFTNAPFEFWSSVSGTDVETIAPPRVTGPFASIINDGFMGLNPSVQDEWQYGPPDFDTFANSLAALDAAYPNGTYTVTAQGVQVPLALTGNLYPSSPPVMSLSGGEWTSDGRYEVHADAEFTVTTSSFGAYGTHALDVVLIELYNDGTFLEQYNFSWDTPANFATMSLAGGTLPPGDYRLDAGFIACSQAAGVPGLPDALAAALYECGTRILLRVLPPAKDTEQFWFTVGKGKWHRQLDATSVVPSPSLEGGGAFTFWANAGGTSMTSAPRVTGPISNPEPGNNAGFLGLGRFGYWRYGWPNFNDWTTGTLAQLNALFGSGTYTFTGAGQVKSVSLAGDIYPTQAPRITVAGGTWIQPGVCLVPATGVTITTSNHPQWGTATGVDQETMLIAGNDSFVLERYSAASESPGNPSLSMTIPAANLVPRSQVIVICSFDNLASSIGIPFQWYATGSYAMTTEFVMVVRSPADLNGDGFVNGDDLGTLLGQWGPCSGCSADLNGDGAVDGDDLGMMLGAWG